MQQPSQDEQAPLTTQESSAADQQVSASVTAAPSMTTTTSAVTSPTDTKDAKPPLTTQETPSAASAPCDGGLVEHILFLFATLPLSFVALCFVAANASSSVQHALAQDKHGRNQDGTTPSFQRVALKNVLAPERHANVHANFCSCCATATQFRPEKLFSNAE